MNNKILCNDHCDTLGELFNIGMGRAANSLSEMVNEEVILSVPELKAINYSDAILSFSNENDKPVSAVEQHFKGQFSGIALLFFSDRSSQELVLRILGELPAHQNLGGMEQEALKEVSNIIINACLGCIADVLDCELQSSVPVVVNGDVTSVMALKRLDLGSDPLVLTLSMIFTLPDNSIQGQISLLMTSDSIKKLVKELERFSSLYT